MILKVKTNLEDYRIHHIRQWAEFIETEPDFQTVAARIRFVSIFSGMDEATLRKVDMVQLNEVFYAYTEMLANHKKRKPKLKFRVGGRKFLWWTFGGQVYKMHDSFKKFTTGQIVDIKTIENVYEDGALFLATLFVPAGEEYGDSDRHERSKVFAKHYPADEFVNLLAFFFESYEKRKTALLTLQLMRARKEATEVLKEIQEEMKSTNG